MGHKIYSIIRHLKKQPFGTVIVGNSLYFVTADKVNDARLMSSLAAWRKKVLRFIPSTKPITVQGTKEWLQRKVIDEPDRLLFLVVADGKPIGHMGLYRYKPKNNSIVVDNVIRGVAGYPGIMGESLLAMIRWAKKTLGIQTFLVDCSSNNDKAIALYKRVGFTEIGREPLIRVKTPGGLVYKDAPRGYTRPIQYYRVLFSMPAKNE